MKNVNKLRNCLLIYGGVVTLFLTSACSSSRLAQVSSSQPMAQVTDQSAALADPQNPMKENTPTTYQTAPADQLVASTSDELDGTPAAAGTNAMLSAAYTERNAALIKTQPEKSNKVSQLKKCSAKVLVKGALKKAEKVQKKFDIKREKAAKAGKALDPDIRTGILIGALGLVLIIVAAVIGGSGGGLIYTLGAIGLTVGLVIIILAALDVI